MHTARSSGWLPGLHKQQGDILDYCPVRLPSWVISAVGGLQPKSCGLPYFRDMNNAVNVTTSRFQNHAISAANWCESQGLQVFMPMPEPGRLL